MSDGKKPVASHKFKRDPDNFYTEPEWCSVRLFEHETFKGEVVDPCAGTGNIYRAALGAGLAARAFDLRDRGFDGVTPNMNFYRQFPRGVWPTDNIVSNPPYGVIPKKFQQLTGHVRMEDLFIDLALRRAKRKVAVFLPSVWLNGAKRARWLKGLPLSRVLVTTPRPSCPPTLLVLKGLKPEGGKVDFSWFIFDHDHAGPFTGDWLFRDD
jgi:hypothetical protein